MRKMSLHRDPRAYTGIFNLFLEVKKQQLKILMIILLQHAHKIAF